MNRIFLGLAFALACNTSYALEAVVGHVTYLEATYLPGLAQFTLDSGSASCPSGAYLKWQKADQSNNKAVYATLMLAMSTGKRIRFYVNEGDTTCVGQYLHLLPD